MKNELKKFDNFLLLNKGLQKVTREGHIRSISIVLKNIKKYNEENLREYIVWMNEQDYSYSHVVNTMTSIEYFSEFRGHVIKFKRTRKPKRLVIDYLTEAEVSFMIKSTKSIREKAAVTLLAFSGMRNQEFCNLKVKDIDFGNNQVMIRQGKYSKDRRANFGYHCTNILVQYILHCRKKSEDYLFTTLQKNNQYQNSDLRKLVKTIAKRANIKKRVFPHIFRHSLATNLLLRGANILLIKEQLGHTDIATTMNYIQRLPLQVLKTQYDYHMPAYI